MINISTAETYFQLKSRKVKKNNFNEFFKNKRNNIKNTWKGIGNLISWKQSASSSNIHLSYLSMKQFQTLRKLPTFLLITSAQ